MSVQTDREIPFDEIEELKSETVELRKKVESYLGQQLPAAYEFDVEPAYPENPNPEAFETDPDSGLVQTLAEVSGGEIRAFDAATEASYFVADAPTVVFGPGVLADDEGPVAHADREYITRTAIEEASDILVETVERIL